MIHTDARMHAVFHCDGSSLNWANQDTPTSILITTADFMTQKKKKIKNLEAQTNRNH